MRFLEIYGKALGKYHWFFILAILIITAVLGFYFTRFEQQTSEDAFIPENEIARAYELIQNEFGGSVGQLIILMDAEDNILSSDSLMIQMGLEERIRNNTRITSNMVSTPRDPDGLAYPGEVVAQSI